MLAPLGGELGQEFLEMAARAKEYAERPEVARRTQAWLRADAEAQRKRDVELARVVVRRATSGDYGGAVQDEARDIVGPGGLDDAATLRAAEAINVHRRELRGQR